jgi:hypothetical protein
MARRPLDTVEGHTRPQGHALDEARKRAIVEGDAALWVEALRFALHRRFGDPRQFIHAIFSARVVVEKRCAVMYFVGMLRCQPARPGRHTGQE